MLTFRGKGIGNGIAIGKIKVYKKNKRQVMCVRVSNVEQEIKRFHQAKEALLVKLQDLYQKALKEVGKSNAAIFETYQIMLRDDNYIRAIEDTIYKQMVNAEFAVASVGEDFARVFSSMEDAYMRERAADVKDVSEHLLTILAGNDMDKMEIDEPVIIVAEDLTPSETVQLDKDNVLAFVTVRGSANSHTAILAKTMSIPALFGVDFSLDEIVDGTLGIADGVDGQFMIEPDEETLSAMQEKRRMEMKKKEALQTLRGKADVTLDGQKVLLYANIGNIKDLAAVKQNDAGGIGLFRSEFMYLEKNAFPTEEEQFQIYKTVVEAMEGKPVIIRTLDIGADKQCDYFALAKEENPALGCRGIRLCLTHPEIFKTQLRALFRASAFGNVAIMYPMIISVDEVRKIKEIVAEIKKELAEQGVAFGNPQQGIMIETPAAVMMSEELAKEVDFFSIGTNDLTQYTLAIDRQNPQMDAFYDTHHPAVLKMIAMVVDNAHKAGIWAGICGELGADTTLTKEFLAMGVDELSVSPDCVLPLRKIILETDVVACRK